MLRPVGTGLSPGDRVGPYLVLFLLGKGGMGEVWAAARRQAGLGFTRLIALKILTGEDVDENDALMFYDEAKAAAALDHAAIVPTVDLGRDRNTLYIAMDLVRGPSLTALLQRLVIDGDVLSPAVVAHIGIQIARALDYAYTRAHHQGRRLRLIHRDVSPHNVLLDVNGAVRLSDFGVARTAIQDHKSRVGTIRGKPSYMAPEQVAGGNLDARTDVFALGIVLYESASLRRLFGRKTPSQSMDAVVRYVPRPLTELVEGFPKRLSAVIAQALEKRPEDRFASSGEFAEALEEQARDLPEIATAASSLVEIIETHFEPEAFDVDAKAQEGFEAARRREPSLRDLVSMAPAMDRSLTHVWPSAPAPDPLDPEVIEALRTQLKPRLERMASMDTRLSFSSYSGTSPRQRRSDAIAATAIGLAGLVTAGVVGFVVTRPEGSVEPPVEPLIPAARVASEPAAEPVAAQSAVPIATPLSQPSPAPKTTPAPTAVEPKRRARPKRARPVARKQKAAKAETGTPIREDATYEEVHALLKRVKALDPERGRAMLATFLEAGQGNVATLNRLRGEARAFLRRHEP